MDCEKFEPLLIDELYDELDEVTSAAVKRHVSGCGRCGPILDGMRRGRRMAALPMLAIPDGLEDRILASVKEAQKVVPIQSRASRALSWAGSWAMRPQTAMAAVFLLMIGTSAFVIRSRHSSERAAAVSVTEQGEPAGQTPTADGDLASLDSKAAAAAHGPNAPAPITAPPVVPTATPTTAASALALNADPAVGMVGGSAGPLDGITAGKGRAAKEDEAFGSTLAESKPKDQNRDKDSEESQQAQRRGGEDRGGAEKKKENRALTRAPAEIGNAAAPGAPAPAPDYAPRSQTIAPPATKTAGNEPQDGFSAGMAAYRSRNFADATRQFDAAARSGDQNAALWAAKSVKDSTAGCGAALPRFEAVAQKSSGTWVGHEAQLEAARCQIANGQLDAARDRLTKLAAVPSHAAPAQQALGELNQVASRREAERAKRGAGAGGGGAGVAARPAAPAPARAAPAKPAATTDRNADGANKASGF